MSQDNYFQTSEKYLKCSLCGMGYHIGGHEYFGVRVFDKDIFICADCYYLLRIVIEGDV